VHGTHELDGWRAQRTDDLAAQPIGGGGLGSPSTADMDARRGRVLVGDQARARLRLAVHLDVGRSLRPIAPGRLVRAPPGPRAHARSGQARSAGARAHPQAQAARRLDALEQQEAGGRAEAAVHDRAAHLEEAQRAAASRRAAHDLQRPGLRDQGGRRDWPVPEPAGARSGLLRRREDGHRGARQEGPDAAAVARARREPRLRIQEERHAEPVCGAEHRHRRGAGHDRAQAHQRPVRRLPRRRRGQPARGHADPRDLRQRQRAQDRRGR